MLQATIETWMLLEYADRGSLEEAIQNRRFQRKSDKSQLDMVCHMSCVSCLLSCGTAVFDLCICRRPGGRLACA
jgi:hypothetical protein